MASSVLDRAIEERVRAALRHSPYHAVQNLICRCDGNAVILEGEVPTYYQKQQAQEIIVHLPDVPAIDNRIVVRGRG